MYDFKIDIYQRCSIYYRIYNLYDKLFGTYMSW